MKKYYIDNERVKDLISRIKDNKQGIYPKFKNVQITQALGSREHRASGWKDHSPTLRARDYKDPNVVAVPTDKTVRLGGLFDNEKGKHQAGSIWDKEGLAPTLDTAQGGYRQPSVIVKEATKKGYAVAKEGDSINISQPNSKTRRGRVGKGVANILLTGSEQCVIEPIVCEQRCDEGLRFFKNNVCGTLRTTTACGDKRVIEPQPCAIRGRNVEDGKIKQQLEVNKDSNVANRLTTVQKDSMVLEPEFRIRKLTPKECFRLMGVNDEDFENVAENQSDSSLYHLAGDSIVKHVLMAIIKKLL